MYRENKKRCAPLEDELGVKEDLAGVRLEHRGLRHQAAAGCNLWGRELPVVRVLHAHEGRHVEVFLEPEAVGNSICRDDNLNIVYS